MSSNENNGLESQWDSNSSDAKPTPTYDRKSFIANSFETNSNSSRISVKLADELLKKNYHPILIFGTRASGKSSLLASLFYYLQSDPSSPAIPVLGDWIVPIDNVYGQSVAEAATHFITHVVNSFHDGEAAPMTRDEYPYYIPIILRPNNGQPEIKIAFLESRGEWYHIDKNSKDLFPELRAEVSDLYFNFSKGLSILLIAPYLIGEAYSEEGMSELAKSEMRESDTALFGALQSYQMNRKARHLDKYLFVLTKWDAHTKSIVAKEFINPPKGMVSHLIAERFPKSWTLFQNMQSGNSQSMQYSAGVMSGNARVNVPDHLRPIMNRFPQMLWSWLYANATDGVPLYTRGKNLDKNQVTSGVGSWLKKLLT